MIGTQCVMCRHYRGGLRCAAFPDGIPGDILTGTVNHEEPYEGDGGIRFEAGVPTLDESRPLPEVKAPRPLVDEVTE